MSVGDSGLKTADLYDLEQQLSHIPLNRLEKYELYEKEPGKYQFVEMTFFNRLCKFFRPGKYDTPTYVSKICQLMNEQLKDEAKYEKVSYSLLARAFQTIAPNKADPTVSILKDKVNSLDDTKYAIETGRISRLVSAFPTTGESAKMVEEIGKIDLSPDLTLLRGSEILQNYRDLLVFKIKDSLPDSFSLDDYNALIQSLDALDQRLGTHSEIELSDLKIKQESLRKKEEKQFSRDLSIFCRSVGKQSDNAPSIMELLKRAERLQLQDATKFERPLRLILKAYRTHVPTPKYEDVEATVQSIENFAKKHHISMGKDFEVVKLRKELLEFYQKVSALNYTSGEMPHKFRKYCADFRPSESAVREIDKVELAAFREKIMVKIRYERTLLTSPEQAGDYTKVLDGLEILDSKLGLGQVPAKFETALRDTFKNFFRDPYANANAFQHALSRAQEGMLTSRYNALMLELKAKFGDPLPFSLNLLHPKEPYRQPITLKTESLSQTFDPAAHKANIQKACREVKIDALGARLEKWVDLVPNYAAAVHTFGRTDLGKTLINGVSAAKAIEAMKLFQGEIPYHLKVPLILEVLYQRAVEANPTMAEDKRRELVANTLAAAPIDYNPILLPSTIFGAMTAYGGGDAPFLFAPANAKEQPPVLFQFLIRPSNVEIKLNNLTNLQRNDNPSPEVEKALFTTTLQRDFDGKSTDWQGSIACKSV